MDASLTYKMTHFHSFTSIHYEHAIITLSVAETNMLMTNTHYNTQVAEQRGIQINMHYLKYRL